MPETSQFLTDHEDGQTPLDPDEIGGLLMGWITTREQLNLVEQENIQAGLDWAERSPKRAKILSYPVLCELHRRMFGNVWGWAGAYRTTERNIGVAPYNIAQEVVKLVDDAKIWIQYNSYPLDELVARFHHKLVWIHPFPNGNGRHSRAAADILMRTLAGTLFTWGASLDPGFARAAYISALRKADSHDFRDLISFVRR